VSIAAAAASGVPVVNQALEPKWVRDGSAATHEAYDTALAFEQTFVEQLSQSLAKDSGLEEASTGEGAAGEAGSGDEGSSASAGDSELATLLPQALTSSIMSAGGLGMAAQMTRQLEGVDGSSAATPAAAGGAGAGTAGAGGAGIDTGASASTDVGAGGGAAAPRGEGT
jgi:hypothetical protein